MTKTKNTYMNETEHKSKKADAPAGVRTVSSGDFYAAIHAAELRTGRSVQPEIVSGWDDKKGYTTNWKLGWNLIGRTQSGDGNGNNKSYELTEAAQ